MAVTDDIKTVVEGIDNISKNGVPIAVKHELDTPTVSYFALMAVLVVVAAVFLVGVKDILVSRITRS
jgi:hypothetical protein